MNRRSSFAIGLLLSLTWACGQGATGSRSIKGTPETSSTTGTSGASGTSSTTSVIGSSSSSANGTNGSNATGGTSAGSSGSTGSSADPTPDLGPSTPIGTVLQATTDVNLRSGPGTSYSVIVVVPTGAQVVTINTEQSQNGFYNVSYGGIQGWTYATYYEIISVPGESSASSSGGSSGSTGSSPSMRDQAITRAQDAMGFSYWWGHGCFLESGPTTSNAGTCTGTCPSCTHAGSYGGDCSGLVGKTWFLGNQDLTVDSHPYSTYDFYNSSVDWHDVDRGSLVRGDALVYNTNGEGHIFLYESGDGWGSMWAYECKGCSYGCVHDLRTADSSYKGIGHNGW